MQVPQNQTGKLHNCRTWATRVPRSGPIQKGIEQKAAKVAKVRKRGVVVHSNVDKLCAIKRGQLFWMGEVEEDGREFAVGGG
jgi:hypothetical protein